MYRNAPHSPLTSAPALAPRRPRVSEIRAPTAEQRAFIDRHRSTSSIDR